MKSLILYLLINLVNGFIDDRPLHYNEYEYNYDYDNDYLLYDDINNKMNMEDYYYCFLTILLTSFMLYFFFN
jgi:hypothetical protein